MSRLISQSAERPDGQVAHRRSVAVLMHCLTLGYLPGSMVNERPMIKLIRMEGDLGRGLKMWRAHKRDTHAPQTDVRQVLDRALDFHIEPANAIGHLRVLTGRKIP